MSDATNPYAVQALSPNDQRLWATLIHVGGILFGFVPAVIGYLLLKDRGAFLREHTATALNFQLTLLLVYFVGAVTSLFVIGLFLLFAAWALTIVFSILAALAANAGRPYVYPLTFKFVS